MEDVTFFANTETNRVAKLLQSDMNNLAQWSNNNFLLLIISNSFFMRFSRSDLAFSKRYLIFGYSITYSGSFNTQIVYCDLLSGLVGTLGILYIKGFVYTYIIDFSTLEEWHDVVKGIVHCFGIFGRINSCSVFILLDLILVTSTCATKNLILSFEIFRCLNHSSNKC